jgi:hypothetical protein
MGTDVAVGGLGVDVAGGGFVVADGLAGFEVADGAAGLEVVDGATAVEVADTVVWLSAGGGVEEGVADPTSPITSWLAVSKYLASMIAVKEGSLTTSSPDICRGVFVLVKVALGRKGVSVEV